MGQAIHHDLIQEVFCIGGQELALSCGLFSFMPAHLSTAAPRLGTSEITLM